MGPASLRICQRQTGARSMARKHRFQWPICTPLRADTHLVPSCNGIKALGLAYGFPNHDVNRRPVGIKPLAAFPVWPQPFIHGAGNASSVVTASAASICPSAPRAAPLATKSWASRVVAKSSGSVLSSRKSKGSTPGICKDFRSVLSGGEHAGRAIAIRQMANRRCARLTMING